MTSSHVFNCVSINGVRNKTGETLLLQGVEIELRHAVENITGILSILSLMNMIDQKVGN